MQHYSSRPMQPNSKHSADNNKSLPEGFEPGDEELVELLRAELPREEKRRDRVRLAIRRCLDAIARDAQGRKR